MRSLTAILVAAVLLGGSLLVGYQPVDATPPPAGPLLAPSPDASSSPVDTAPVVASLTAEAPPSPAPSNAASSYFTVVGAVRFPGTYSSDDAQVLLSDLIERAGGVNQDATGTIRLLNDRRSEQVAFSADLPPVSVTAGSTIVVESNRSGPHRAAADEPTVTDVACINLLDRPVVLFLTPGYESVAKVLDSLGQPPELQSSLQVISSQRGLAAGRSMLTSGAVLIFDPAQIDRAALARVEAHLRQDVQPFDAAETTEPPQEVVDALQLLRQGMTVDERATREPPSTTETSQQPALLPKRSLPDPVAVEHPAGPALNDADAVDASAGAQQRIDDDAAQPGLVISARSEVHARTPARYVRESRPQSGPSEPRVAATTGLSAPEPETNQSPSVATHDAAAFAETDVQKTGKTSRTTTSIAGNRPGEKLRKRSKSSLTGLGKIALATGLIATLGLLGAVSWAHLERRRRRRASKRAADSSGVPQTARTGEPALPAQPAGVLDELINNTMPLIEEETVFPEELKFHGRTVGYRYLLHSEPHSLKGPHFASRQQSRPTEQVAVAAAGGDSEPQANAERTNQHRRDVGPLERALRAANKSQQSENPQ